jgi:3-polyprenyl-4-hydroxybenzoate decarboxylase
VKRNPVFHLTAITHRKDALFQTATIGGRYLARTETAQLTTVKAESAAWAALQTAVREPLGVYATPASGGMYNVRVSLRQRVPGEARNAITAVFGSKADCKHVFVFDEDIDIFSDEMVDWALATRFQGDRDLVVATGFRVVPLDPSLTGARTGAKTGFDCTIPFGRTGSFEWAIPAPPKLPARERRATVVDALAADASSFAELMASLGSRDGREIVRELDKLYGLDRLGRRDDGRYVLKDGK